MRYVLIVGAKLSIFLETSKFFGKNFALLGKRSNFVADTQQDALVVAHYNYDVVCVLSEGQGGALETPKLTSIMAKSCARFQPVKPGSEEHNRRLKRLDYVRDELTKNNMSWSAQSVHDRYEQIKLLVKDKTGRSIQSKATPIREAVVLIKPDTTMEDLHRLREAYYSHFGIDVFQIDIHKDEGHFDKKGKWKGNLHAHLTADFTNHQTGKSLKLNSQQMSSLQTVTAEVLGMQRGVSSERKHLTALQYKTEEIGKQLEELRQEMSALGISKAAWQRFLGLLGLSTKDKALKAQDGQIRELRGELEELHKIVKLLEAKPQAEVTMVLRKVAIAAGLPQSRQANPVWSVDNILSDLQRMKEENEHLHNSWQKAERELRQLKQHREVEVERQLKR